MSATFEIARLGAQGDGVADTETGQVFIPFALPSETVTAARIKDRADLIGWIVDLFLIPSMDRDADRRFVAGSIEYSVAWLLLTFLGIFGIHRFYMGKWGTGILYLLTGGLFLVGVLYDFCTLNSQVSDLNSRSKASALSN